ncbi:MAG: RlmE family RNA methyltransferase, partial [Euryarchaeota archaeon]|nr:RlmE family RNA methyltransferase [Euryarchaeota archaeon]
MSKRWLSERRRDYYYKKAKEQDYRSRAAFKLKQIDARFRIFRAGASVVDLGAAPGGWLQVAKEAVGMGKVVGVDLQPIEPIEGVVTIRGDIRSQEVVDRLLAEIGGR